MNLIGVYSITNLINGKRYIGKSIDIESRTKDIKERKLRFYRNQYLTNSINKFGIENFDINILEECSESVLNEREIYWINYYRTYIGFQDCNGYNLTLGGDGTNGYTYKMSEEHKKNISKALTGRKFSDTTKERLSLSHIGKSNSEERNKHISSSMKGRVFTEEHKKNLSKSAKGKCISQDQRMKISKTLTGFKHTDETKAKMSNTRSGYKCVNDGVINKYIYSNEEVTEYLSNGWFLGKLRKG